MRRSMWRNRLHESGPELPQWRRILEQCVWGETNSKRRSHGLPDLAFSSPLANIAYEYSRDMCLRHYFAHETPDGLTLGDRVDMRLLGLSMTGENIIMTDTNRELATSEPEVLAVGEDLVRRWMNSPGHRKNILTPEFTMIGIGIYLTTDDVYGTQLFGA